MLLQSTIYTHAETAFLDKLAFATVSDNFFAPEVPLCVPDVVLILHIF